MKLRTLNFLIMFFALTFTVFAEEDWVKEEAALNIELATNWMGIPEGYKSQGNEIYIDLDAQTQEIVPFGTAPENENWDIVFTHILQDVKMGPMGVHPIPFFDIKVNAEKGVTFYMLEGDDEGDLDLEDVDMDAFVTAEHKGYGHKDWKDNKKLEKYPYHSEFPYLSYDWYEFKKMMRFEMVPYSPKRTFVFKTTDGQFAEFIATEVIGKMDNKLYKASYQYQLIED